MNKFIAELIGTATLVLFGCGAAVLGGRGGGVKRKPNYLDLNAAVKHRPAGRAVGRAAIRGRIGSRGGRGGGRGPPVVERGRGRLGYSLSTLSLRSFYA